MFIEDKHEICNLLCKTLQATRGGYDILSVTYVKQKDAVIVLFAGGGVKTINVAMDSGVAMIRDVMKNLGV